MMNSIVYLTCRYAPKTKCIVVHKEVEPDKWISCNDDFFSLSACEVNQSDSQLKFPFQHFL